MGITSFGGHLLKDHGTLHSSPFPNVTTVEMAHGTKLLVFISWHDVMIEVH